ncbi:hypothetical protein QBC32DRAFT_319919 [Pseudoneurospora amorphoporcata]|uniref:Uncharacterized protein n=1 Tax=Pseudoneurospora amorphoporcata TaxID=241081 RepID=A0AAN6SA18_9PEZI|nr:hypothetical protein QBC32DRAFT_319919 [Pseudoneurospora amorphoporcata]
MSDSGLTTIDPKVLWRKIYDILNKQFERAKHEWHHEEAVYKNFEREPRRFENLQVGISTGSVDTLKEILTNVQAKFPRSLVTVGKDGKSPLQEWVDTLSLQNGKYTYDVRTWNPVETDDFVLAAVRALESLRGPSQETSTYASDIYDSLFTCGVSIEKLHGQKLSPDAVGVIKEMYNMVRGSGNDPDVELHSESAKKVWAIKHYDDFIKLKIKLDNKVSK